MDSQSPVAPTTGGKRFDGVLAFNDNGLVAYSGCVSAHIKIYQLLGYTEKIPY